MPRGVETCLWDVPTTGLNVLTLGWLCLPFNLVCALAEMSRKKCRDAFLNRNSGTPFVI